MVTVHTWADGIGTWHAAVFISGSAGEAINIARDRIGNELVDRGNAETARFVQSDDFTVRLIGVEPQPSGLTRYEYVEAGR